MEPFNKQLDFPRILAKFNKQIGDQLGRILILEAEAELLRENINFLENKISELEGPNEAPEPTMEEARKNGAAIKRAKTISE